jgi:CubicO group peptidase (beta-lactamase class C family)
MKWFYLVLLGLAACASTPQSTPPCAMPIASADWPVLPATQAGFDAIALCQLLQDSNQLHSLLIERNGQLIAEAYYTGADHPISQLYGLGNPLGFSTHFDANTLHDTRSISKSVVSLIFGAEQSKGRAPAVYAPLQQFYPDLIADNTITFKHLLSMSSGQQWNEWGHGVFTSDETPLFWANEPGKRLLERSAQAAPGTIFNYSGGATTVIAETLVKISGKTLTMLAHEDLFEPLGIHQYEWVSDIHGRALPFAGLRLRPRDMLKIGRLLSSGGVWQGRQIIPKEWILESTQPHIKTEIPLFSIEGEAVHYGYQWWTGQIKTHNRPVQWIAAIGNGGQRIISIPELALTIVFTAGGYGSAEIQYAESQLLSKILATIK